MALAKTMKILMGLLCCLLEAGLEPAVAANSNTASQLLRKKTEQASTSVHRQSTGHLFSTTDRHEHTTGHRQSTTGRHEPTTGHRQSTTGRLFSTTSRVFSTTGQRQSTTGHREPTRGRFFSTTGHRASTTDRLFSTTGERNPTTDLPFSPTGHRRSIGSPFSTAGHHQSKTSLPYSTSGRRQSISLPYSTASHLSSTRAHRSSTTSDLFQCNDGYRFINRTLLCNGRIDCPDSSDENSQLCNGTSCINTFPCYNRICIDLKSVCNGINDCGDNSDEDSTLCGPEAVSKVITCADGQVLNGVNILCNRVYNCVDKSDEFNCTQCPEGLSCDKGRRCVKVESICDRVQDCYDGADETCLSPNNQRCNIGDFICPTGICANKDYIMSDSICWNSQVSTGENNQKLFESPNVLCEGGNKCLPPEYRCDGKRDCQDGADDVCDGSDNCGDYSDESSSVRVSTFTKYSLAVFMPLMIFFSLVGLAFSANRRRVQSTTRTTQARNRVIMAVAKSLVNSTVTNQGIANPAYVSPSNVSK